MAEDLEIISGSKEDKYQSLLPQIQGLLVGENDLTANLANVAAALKEQFGWLWVGFYLVKPQKDDQAELVLGPFQGFAEHLGKRVKR
jgi:GAF domain-containing protein